ncbi:unnamed protein product [Bursaphelenchus okinawaensis]|uniref:Uncharacterized protein n=1 Tax=Bursaphelenchus okinawaensis TaxID=465554 RepID=A0A811LDL3_9BILA|nr:unnamed protein product [Bursaphelenchus okinawaensis]CAG9121287.1 unnamed protein product [Bursaphelenchus okinawaensis]
MSVFRSFFELIVFTCNPSYEGAMLNENFYLDVNFIFIGMIAFILSLICCTMNSFNYLDRKVDDPRDNFLKSLFCYFSPDFRAYRRQQVIINEEGREYGIDWEEEAEREKKERKLKKDLV